MNDFISFMFFSPSIYISFLASVVPGILGFKTYKNKKGLSSFLNFFFPICLILVGIVNIPMFMFSILAVFSLLFSEPFSYIFLSYLVVFIVTPLSLIFGVKWFIYIKTLRRNEKLNIITPYNKIKIIGPVILILNGFLIIPVGYIAMELGRAFSKAWSAG